MTTAGVAPPALVLMLALVGMFTRASLESFVLALMCVSVLVNGSVLLDPGPVSSEAMLTTDVIEGGYGPWASARIQGVDVFLDLPVGEHAALGDMLHVEGTISTNSRFDRGKPVSVITVNSYSVSDNGPTGYVAIGNSVRSTVLERLRDGSEVRGLLAGFLVGDTSDLSDVTQAEMKSAGLSHFVAVSGSNVALYLGFVAALAIPLGVNPKRRAAVGLVSLPIFVVATRFEPSVLRASAMAATALLGRVTGTALETWQTIGLGGTILLLFDPWLAMSAGFQLSLAATSGVVLGARWPGPDSWLIRAFAVTAGAQLSVAPLLLLHFGSVPLMGPVSNLFAAPLVVGSTLLATVGVLGVAPALQPASWMAELVIQIAKTAAGWPQVGFIGLTVFLGVMTALARLAKHRREYAAVIGAIVVVLMIVPLGRGLEAGEVAVLDVGQGDSILFYGGAGQYGLVDGGPNPAVLMDHLSRYGVRNLAVVVVSHVHADHVKGLTGLIGRVAIQEIWLNVDPHVAEATNEFLMLADSYGIPVRTVYPGDYLKLGILNIEVVAPLRRYASPNDQSVVLTVSGPGRDMLLSGDVEGFAQSDLVGLSADVLKVPHHGATTSSAEWLESVGAEMAVISVGENDFGHPDDAVIELLVDSGATVFRTDQDGTVIFDLG